MISNGIDTLFVDRPGSPRRVGGQGDILAGSIATFVSWALKYKAAHSDIDFDPLMIASEAAAELVRESSGQSYSEKRRAMLTTDILAKIGSTFSLLFEPKL